MGKLRIAAACLLVGGFGWWAVMQRSAAPASSPTATVATVLPKSIARPDSTLRSPALECAHPFIPSRPGTFAKFRVSTTGATNVSSIYEYRALDAHADADALAVRWQLSVRDERKATPARTFQEMRRCYANRAAEDPWSGYLMGVAAPEQTGERWRWPTALHRGDHFGGEFAVHPGRGPISQLGFARTHESWSA